VAKGQLKGVVKVTFYLPPEVRKELRMQALREDISATGLVARLITEYLRRVGPRKTR
jgi:predicted DNA-binding protein (UPF0278 family)